MDKVRNKRAIVDRLALMEEALGVLDSSDRHGALLDVFKSALASGEAEIERRFMDDQDGEAAVTGRCFLIDQLIRVIHDIGADHIYPAGNPTATDQLGVTAYGGYGRGELAPKSDIDLLFILPYKQTPRGEQIVEHILYTLWDLGLKVGHATRSLDDCIRMAKSDYTVRTGLLETRFIWGRQNLYLELRRRFLKEVVSGNSMDFVEAKLRERDDRHNRLGDSRYVLEPNIKEGKGGLRDLQTLFWIGKYLYRAQSVKELIEEGVLTKEEAQRFARAQRFLWTVRCHLHYLTGRPEERLTFDVQPELARRMGYADRSGVLGVERFMRHYFLVAKDVGDLTRIFCAALEAREERRPLLSRLGLFSREVAGFPVEGGRINTPTAHHFADHPVDLLRLFKLAHENNLDVHPNALQQVTRNLRRIDKTMRDDPAANRIFLDILTARKDPEVALRRMNEAGVFGRFITDFGRVVAQMQYDMYHVYTTDEHTIRAIGILNGIERGAFSDDHPVASEVIHNVLSREVLYVALLLHDIAKGRGGDHSELGAKVARKLCPRLGLTGEQTETVAWLVQHHLAMSATAFKRDLNDAKTILDFVELVQSPERLRLLLCLTVADIRAVGPGRWNNWKAVLLRELYHKAEDVMGGTMGAVHRNSRVARAQDALAERLADWDAAARDAYLDRAPPGYWLSFDADALERQARLARAADAQGQQLALDRRIDPEQGVTEITIYCIDQPGLFSRIAGAMALAGANIVAARIATFNDGMAMDVFSVQDAEGGAFSRPDKLAKLSALIEQALEGRLRSLKELRNTPPQTPTRTRIFTVEPRVLIDNKASNTHTVVEVNGRDRPGLLYEVTGALADCMVQISTAKISTFGEQVVDVFYVKDMFGMKIDHRGKLEQVRQHLLKALADPFAPEEKKPRRRRTAKPVGKPAVGKAEKPAAEKSGGKAKAEPPRRKRAAAAE